MSVYVHHWMAVKRLLGFAGFGAAALLGLLFATGGRADGVSVLGAPVIGLGVLALLAQGLYAQVLPRLLRAPNRKGPRLLLAAGLSAMLLCTIPLWARWASPHNLSAWLLWIAAALTTTLCALAWGRTLWVRA